VLLEEMGDVDGAVDAYRRAEAQASSDAAAAARTALQRLGTFAHA
jgi:hypothetical protein